MRKNDMIEKRIILVDGEELPGLINVDEYPIEDGVVDVPGRDRSVPVRDGVRKIPQIGATYKLTRDSKSLKLLENWYYKHENHDVTMIRIDGSGVEFARELWPNTEISKLHAPGYDASSPVTAQAMITFLPEDIIPIKAEA